MLGARLRLLARGLPASVGAGGVSALTISRVEAAAAAGALVGSCATLPALTSSLRVSPRYFADSSGGPKVGSTKGGAAGAKSGRGGESLFGMLEEEANAQGPMRTAEQEQKLRAEHAAAQARQREQDESARDRDVFRKRAAEASEASYEEVSQTSSSSSSSASADSFVDVGGEGAPSFAPAAPRRYNAAQAEAAAEAASAAAHSKDVGLEVVEIVYADAHEDGQGFTGEASGTGPRLSFEEEARLFQEELERYNERLLLSFGPSFARAVDVMRFARTPTSSVMIKRLQLGALESMTRFARRRTGKASASRLLSKLTQRVENMEGYMSVAGRMDNETFNAAPNLFDKYMGYYLRTPWQYRVGKRLVGMQPASLRRVEWFMRTLIDPTLATWALTKPRVTLMVVVTAWWGYAVMVPYDTLLWSNVGVLCGGTYMAAAAASIINQIREVDVDSRMSRTARRPLVAGSLSMGFATGLAAALTAGSAAVLAAKFGPLVAGLAVGNVILYGGIYTSLKRTTPLNTEVGALVGAVPPLMGYFASLPAGADWTFDPVGMLWPAAVMFAWQMQHVMLICRMRGDEYNISGLRMQCYKDPRYARTIAKGIAWAWVCIPVVAAPMFAQWADIGHVVATSGWVAYAYFYTRIMLNTPPLATPGVALLLWGYALLLATIVLGLNSQRKGRYDHVEFDLEGLATRPKFDSDGRPFTFRERRELVAYGVTDAIPRDLQASVIAQRRVQDLTEQARR